MDPFALSVSIEGNKYICYHFLEYQNQESYTEISIGEMLLELSEIRGSHFVSMIENNPYNLQPVTIEALTDCLPWLHDAFIDGFKPAVADLLAAHFSNMLMEYKDNKEEYIAHIQEQYAGFGEIEKKLAAYGYDQMGDSNIQHLILSLIMIIGNELGVINHIKNMLFNDDANLIKMFTEREMLDIQHFGYRVTILEGHFISIYDIETLFSMMIFEVYNILDKDIGVNKCENCGEYFLPKNRSDTKYCDRPSPQDSNRSCKEYGTQKLWYDKLQKDEAKKLARNIYMSKQMLIKRNPDIAEYQTAFDQYKQLNSDWKQKVKSGDKTNEEYIEWLKKVKSKKVIL